VVLALLPARTSAVTTVAQRCMSRLPAMEMNCRDSGLSEIESKERKRLYERLARTDFAPRVREAMQLKTRRRSR
jgi:hypothetical protein